MNNKKSWYSCTLKSKDEEKEQSSRAIVLVGKSTYVYVVEKQKWVNRTGPGNPFSGAGARLLLRPVLMRWHLM